MPLNDGGSIIKAASKRRIEKGWSTRSEYLRVFVCLSLSSRNLPDIFANLY